MLALIGWVGSAVLWVINGVVAVLGVKAAIVLGVAAGGWFLLDVAQDFALSRVVQLPAVADARTQWALALTEYDPDEGGDHSFDIIGPTGVLGQINYFVGLDVLMTAATLVLTTAGGCVLYKVVWKAIPFVG